MKSSALTKAFLFCFAVALGVVPSVAAAKQVSKSPAPAKDVMQVLRLFDFEMDLEGFRIPDWAFAKNDNAALDVDLSNDVASNGKKSVRVNCNFPPKMWSGAYIEIERESGNFMDFTGHQYVLADIYIPADAPKLKGEIIMTVGDNWSWTEMRQAIQLAPGQWNTVQADITPDGTDWKIRMTDEVVSDVRKLGVRVSSNQPSYKGPIYIDNIRLGSMKKGKKK